MKKLFLLALVAVALTTVACNDSKKGLFPLSGTDSASLDTVTVVEKGSSVSDSTATESTATEPTQASTEQSGTTSGDQTAVQDSSSTSTEQTSTQETTTPTATETPADQNKDTSSNDEFQYATVKNIDFDLMIMADASTSIAKASINVSANGEAISSSITDTAGKAAFNTTVNQTCSSLDVVIEHPDYVSKTVKVDNIQDLALISRVIYLEKKKTETPVIDTDKDGVADDADQFPSDPTLIAAVYKEYTIAFEDLYPNKGDADFNDLAVKFGITEYINPENKISKINIRSKVLAAGAGYKNLFYINILGKDYLLISDPKKDLNQKFNSKKNEQFVNAPVHSLDIVFENPVGRTEIAPMPYDPFIMANSDKKNQVHLPFVTTKFVGKTLDTDKFPWAVLVPDEWTWPYEGTEIFKAYPDFQKWYQSDGKEYQDWYLKPNTTYTFPVPGVSALTAYLIKNGHVSTAAALGALIGVMVTAVVIINIRRRKLFKKIEG